MNTDKKNEARTRLVVIGGFLGSGKTTAILGLAKRLLKQDVTLGIVTNDQGSDLVDTETMRRNDLHVMEVTGGCFCCDFDQFATQLEAMGRDHSPNMVLAEPVGSCINLVATVMKPMARFTGTEQPQIDGPRLSLSPLSVIVDPRRLRRVMKAETAPSRMPDPINYLFLKQIEEADFIVLNKCDLLTANEIEGCTTWLRDRFPGATVLEISATAGTGMDEWTHLLLNRPLAPERPSLDIHYDTYVQAESALGWLNVRAGIASNEPLDGNALLTTMIEQIRDGIATIGGDTVHLKAYLVSGNDWVKMSCTDNDQPPGIDHRMATPLRQATLVLNVRALADPEDLKRIVKQAVSDVFGECADMRDEDMVAFRPEYAGPTYIEE